MPTKSWQTLFYFAWCKPLLSGQYYFKNMTNERIIRRIVTKTFEEIDSFLNSIFILKHLNKKIERAIQNFPTILSKWIKFGTKWTNFEKIVL